MSLLEFADKTSPVPLTEWQQSFLAMYEQAVKDGIELVCLPPRGSGRDMVMKTISEYYENPISFSEPLWPYHDHYQSINVYCQGTKKIGIPCKRYLGKVEGRAELLCPICKTVNVVNGGEVAVEERVK